MADLFATARKNIIAENESYAPMRKQYDEAKAGGSRPWTTVYFGANSELGRRLMELSVQSGMSINKLCRCLVESAIDRAEIKTERRTVVTKKLVIDGKEFI